MAADDARELDAIGPQDAEGTVFEPTGDRGAVEDVARALKAGVSETHGGVSEVELQVCEATATVADEARGPLVFASLIAHPGEIFLTRVRGPLESLVVAGQPGLHIRERLFLLASACRLVGTCLRSCSRASCT